MSAIVWSFVHALALPFLGIGMKTDLFQSCGHCWVFQICWHIECSTFTASSFRIWNSSPGIPSPPLALFIVMFPKAHLTSHSRVDSLEKKNQPKGRFMILIKERHIAKVLQKTKWKIPRISKDDLVQKSSNQAINDKGNLWGLVKRGNRRRQWHPTPVLLPGKSHGRRSLVGCSP